MELSHKNPTEQATFYGLEKNPITIRLAKMNLAVHGLEGTGKASNDSFTDIILKLTRKRNTLDILEFSIAASETFWKLSIDLKRNGTEIGDFDLLIASIALTYGETLLTRNVRHFSRVPGLAVESY
jgi:type I restriction-modification system DNA methylase subunit